MPGQNDATEQTGPADVFHRATQSVVQLNRVRCIKTQNASTLCCKFFIRYAGKGKSPADSYSISLCVANLIR